MVNAGRRSRVEGMGNECESGRCDDWYDDGGLRSRTSVVALARTGPSWPTPKARGLPAFPFAFEVDEEEGGTARGLPDMAIAEPP